MKRVARVIVVSCVFAAGATLARAEQMKMAEPMMDPAKQAAMEAMQQLGSPSEGHKALEPFVGTWTYTAQWWMSPDGAPESMRGTTTSRLIFGGRFLQQEVRGEVEGQPPFEGIGLTGYDNIRKEYSSAWLDNMSTGIMTGTGQFDHSTNTLTEHSDFSCPMTGEAHRTARAVWTVVDPDHNTYESYMRTPEGAEYKAMRIEYARAQ